VRCCVATGLGNDESDTSIARSKPTKPKPTCRQICLTRSTASGPLSREIQHRLERGLANVSGDDP
jgi:hypothetical protein